PLYLQKKAASGRSARELPPSLRCGLVVGGRLEGGRTERGPVSRILFAAGPLLVSAPLACLTGRPVVAESAPEPPLHFRTREAHPHAGGVPPPGLRASQQGRRNPFEPDPDHAAGGNAQAAHTPCSRRVTP